MSWRDTARMWGGHAKIHVGVGPDGRGASRYPVRRMFRYGAGEGGDPDPQTPVAGGTIAGVVEEYFHVGIPAVPGIAVKIEAGGSFSAGTELATDSSGRVVAATGSQIIVARALYPSSGAAQVVWCTFETQRPRGQW